MNIYFASFAKPIVALSVLFALALWHQPAQAETMAGLRFNVGSDVDARTRTDIEDITRTAFDRLDGWSFLHHTEARRRLNPIVQDCFTQDCLKKAGEALGLRAGISIEFSGKAQIYEWKANVYDLRTGTLLDTGAGTCELCGRTEVLRNYTKTLDDLLVRIRLPAEPEPQGVVPDTAALPPVLETVRLRISVIPADASIYIGEDLVGSGDVTVPVEVGTHEVRFSHEGYRSLRETVVVGEPAPNPILLRVHLSKEASRVTHVVRGDGPVDRLGDYRQTIGWTAVGVGSAFIVTGIILTAIDGGTTCDDGSYAQCPEIYRTGGAGLTMGILGTALATSGAGLLTWELLSGKNDSDERGAEIKIGPSLGSGAAGMLLQGRF